MSTVFPYYGTTSDKGKYGEEKAAGYLEAKGYQILKRNFRCEAGEVDIIASNGDTLLFVEVKCWQSLGKESLERSINRSKRERLLSSADCYLQDHPEWNGKKIAFDLIFVSGKTGNVDHIKEALI